MEPSQGAGDGTLPITSIVRYELMTLPDGTSVLGEIYSPVVLSNIDKLTFSLLTDDMSLYGDPLTSLEQRAISEESTSEIVELQAGAKSEAATCTVEADSKTRYQEAMKSIFPIITSLQEINLLVMNEAKEKFREALTSGSLKTLFAGLQTLEGLDRRFGQFHNDLLILSIFGKQLFMLLTQLEDLEAIIESCDEITLVREFYTFNTCIKLLNILYHAMAHQHFRVNR